MKTDTNGKKAPLLPLVPDHEDTMNSGNSLSYSLRTVPTDADSAHYKKYIRVITGSEDIRTVIQWRRNIEEVIKGLNVTEGPAQHNLLCNMTSGSAHSLFTIQAIAEATPAFELAMRNEADPIRRKTIKDAGPIPHITHPNVLKAVNHVMTSLIPNKIVAMVKRYLRRECRKPADMKVRTYYQHLVRINMDEMPMLPPNFSSSNCLSNDEMVDILIYGCPKSWAREMDE